MPLPLRARDRYMLDTIGLVVTHDHELVATCQPCGRAVVLDLDILIQRWGKDWPRNRVRARCGRCSQPATVKLRPIRPMPDARPQGRSIPFIFDAAVEHMIEGDRVHYGCTTCGDHWALSRDDILAHPMVRDHRLRDTFITACGNCGESSRIAARPEWVAEKCDP